jgi:long-chain acyl-CoA synthetase
VDLRIRRADGTEAERGETGEVVLSGAMVMRGYCNSPDASGKVLQQGWLRTGDLGRLDRDGFLHIDDRVSNIFVCNGVEVSCADVERVVLDSNLAAEAAAVAIEDTGRGTRLVVAIACDDRGTVDESRIVHALAGAGYTDGAQPHIVRLDSLPRTVSGKVDRREVRRQVLANYRI